MSTVLKVWRDPKKGDQYQKTLNLTTYQVEESMLDTYLVRFADNNATIVEAGVASDGMTAIPTIGSGRFGLTCTRVFPKRSTKHPSLFEVQLEYKSAPPPKAGKQNVNISVTPSIYSQDAWEDADGKAVRNSAGQSLNPTLKRAYYDSDIHVTFDCDASSAQGVITAAEACEGHYSGAPVTMTVNGVSKTFGQMTLLFGTVGYSTVYTGQPPYTWKMAYYFRYRKDNWIDEVQDRGYAENIGGVWQVAQAKYGVQHREPIGLNGSGRAQAPTDKPIYLQFDMYGAADFTALLAGIQ